MSQIVHMPLPMTSDQDLIDQGRMRALEMYQGATTDGERKSAMFWFHHWRWLNVTSAAAKRVRVV